MTITMNLGTLQPGTTGWLWERVQIPASGPLGTALTASAVVNPTTGDVRPRDNLATESETVQGSYDPNAIAVRPWGVIELNDTLEYTIFFQNTGTDTAFTVRLTDSLDTDLDPATVEPGASSHPSRFGITAPAELLFRFDNITLPDRGAVMKLKCRARAAGTPSITLAASRFEVRKADGWLVANFRHPRPRADHSRDSVQRIIQREGPAPGRRVPSRCCRVGRNFPLRAPYSVRSTTI